MNPRTPAFTFLGLSSLTYRVLLRLFPHSYRHRYGHDLVSDFSTLTRDSWIDAGRLSAFTFWFQAIVALTVHGLKERTIWVVASLRFSKRAYRGAANLTGAPGSGRRPPPPPPRFAGLQSVDQDVRYAIRSFARSPMFSLVAVVTLALGIGSSTAIFSVVDGVILRPLPYPESHRLVKIGNLYKGSSRGINHSSPADFLQWRAQTTVFESMAASVQSTMVLLGQGEPERLSAPAVSGGFFDVLGVPPLLGRGIQYADDKAGAPQIAVLSYGLWRRRWGGDSTVVGTTVTLSGVPHTIVGVMPASFRPPETLEQPNAQLWLSLAASGVVDLTSTDGGYGLSVVARLKPHVTIAQAGQDLRRVGTFFPPNERVDLWPDATSLHGETVDVVRSTLTTLLGSVGLLLLIACANVANLFLARGTDRTREFAVRTALGAGRRRIVRQLLTECVLLALVGGALGVGLAVFGVRAFVALNPGNVPRLEEVGIDLRVLAFALVTATATGIFFGLVPAFRTARRSLTGALREGGNLMSSRGRNRLRSILVVAQTALALMLTTGAGLVLNSLIRLHRVDLGFDPDGVLAMEVSSVGGNYETPETRLRFFQELEDRIAAIPSVTTAGAANMRPLGGPYQKATIFAEGSAVAGGRLTGVHYVSSGYIDAMEIPLLRGSGLPPDGGPAAATDIVVNEAIVRTYWPDQDPIGKRIRYSHSYEMDGAGRPWYRVVGVVGNVKNRSLQRSDFPEIYISFLNPEANLRSMAFVARASQGSASVAAAMRQAAWDLDPSLPIAAVQSMEDHVAASITSPRFFAWLFATFATIALVLASVGIYGAMSYSTGQRIQEVGLRKALGAESGDVVRLMIRQGLGVVTIGLVLGLIGAIGLSQVLTSFLFGVTPTDPVTLVFVVIVIGTAALAACYVPSRRAASVDPMETLRRC